MLFVTIYDHPRDAPDHWVVRDSQLNGGVLEHSPFCARFRELEIARAFILKRRPWLVQIQWPGQDPDPVVYEVYC